MNTPTISTDVFTETVPRAVAEVGSFLETIPDAVSAAVASGVSSGVSTGRRVWRSLPWTHQPVSRSRWIVAGSIVIVFGAGLIWLTRRTVTTQDSASAGDPTVGSATRAA